MEHRVRRIPGFPFVPFIFPIGLLVGLLASMVWLEYRIWQDLEKIEGRH